MANTLESSVAPPAVEESIAPQPKKAMRLTFLDGLRGFAALWVLLYHIWNRFYPSLTTQAHVFKAPHPTNLLFYLTFVIFQYGYIGVDIFFVLSGFCIHYAQARMDDLRDFRLSDFARRRFFRLYPAYLVSIGVSIVALGILPLMNILLMDKHVNLVQALNLRGAAINATFLQLVWPDSLGFNGVYWTLVYEVQFYAFYPLLLIASRRLSLTALLLGLLVAEIFCAYHPFAVPNVFIYRYYEWCLGMLAAEIAVRTQAMRVGTPLIVATSLALAMGFLSVFQPLLYPLRDTLLSTGFFGLILVAVRAAAGGGGPIANGLLRMLEARWLVGVGLFSYSLYLIHVPVIDVIWKFYQVAVKLHPGLAPAICLLPVLCIVCSLALARFLYRVVEKPFMEMGKVRKLSPAPSKA